MKIEYSKHLFVCDCGDLEHQFVVSYFDDDLDFTYVHVYLKKMPLWSRLKAGLAYIFGKQSRYGAFGEVLLTPEQCVQLADVLKQRGIHAGQL